MPAKTTDSNIYGKLGSRLAKAHEQHKGDETTFTGGGSLPPGIDNGIAQLVDVKFDTYKKGDNIGEPYFYAAGVVVEPKTFEGRKLEGKRTSLMEPMHDTPKRSRASLEEHYAWVLNELRKLGVDTSEIEVDQLQDVFAALKEAKPYFNFRTWKGEPTPEYPNPRTNETWDGANDDYAPSEDPAMEGVEEQTPSSEKTPPAKKPTTATPPTKTPPPKPATSAKTPPTKSPPAKKAPEPPPQSAEPTLEELLEAANNKDADAQTVLTDKAVEIGWDRDAVDAATSWEAVVEMIQNGPPASEGEGIEEGGGEPEWMPEVEQIYGYRPKDKSGKKAAKPTEHEITAVDQAKKTVNLKNIDNPKLIYKAVPFDDLESME